MPGLEFLKLHVVLEAADPAPGFELPGLPTLAIHGALARAFRGMACGSGEATCRDCPREQKDICPYWQVFERFDAATEVSASSGAMPRPYFLSPGNQATFVASGGAQRTLSFDIGLVGTAVRLYPLFVYALQHGRRDGVGARRTRYTVREVSSVDPATGCAWHLLSRDGQTLAGGVPVVDEQWFRDRAERMRPSGVTMELLTPLRIKESGSLADSVTFAALVRAIMRRLRGLRAYGRDSAAGESAGTVPRQELEEPEHGTLDLARTVEADLAWVDVSRYSSSQKAWMKFGGLVGRVGFEGIPERCIPLLLAAEFLHVGKQVTFGLGQVRCVWWR